VVIKIISKVFLIFVICVTTDINATSTASGVFEISIDSALSGQNKPDGRIFIFLNENLKGEPRTQIWPLNPLRNHMFAKNHTGLLANAGIKIDSSSKMITSAKFGLDSIPVGKYMLQVLWDSDRKESRIDAPGNIYSKPKEITISKDFNEKIVLSEKIPERTLDEHPLVKKVKIRSELLSNFWGRPYFVQASILLPRGYHQEEQLTYPIRYNVAGYGGRYTRVNRLVKSERFMTWWNSDEAPKIINVYLDGEGPYGDSYQLDSANSGPFGSSLINELIPAIEKQVRAKGEAKYRFTDGCSTGGWVSLALQLFYPDSFNGAWSYSADSIDFSAYQLTNLYEDTNVFYNEWKNLRPVARDLSGDPIVTMKDFIQYENVLGISNDYRTSGGQFSAHTALYSPKGDDGLPSAMFDPKTGDINKDVVEAWKKYDLKIFAEKNWKTLGPKLQDKIYIWMGDMDNFYLNPATRKFADFLNKTENPKSNAVVQFDAMEGHCSQYGNKIVLEKMAKRLVDIN
jgi:hypothetical protein